ncbi:MAG: glucose-6-phosphate isomerase [Oscillospiraceae bacterium]|jgi:glucose-6-phosphate isomerase|nr:glucose-6-phosphate isomerase [Oscillospiraceae bacterium]
MQDQYPRIRLDVSNMMAENLGGRGINPNAVDRLASMAAAAQTAVQAQRGAGWLGWTELPYNQDDVVARIEEAAARVRARFANFVVLGIGGSALGPQAVQLALNHLHYNDLPAAKRPGPRLFVEDNIDPERMGALLDIAPPHESCYCVITKSGATAETMSQYLIISDLLKAQVGEGWQRHIIAVTDAAHGNLVQIARTEGFETFVIPDGVGGRFSELCPVGLLPAAVCGIDIRGLLAGAAAMDAACHDVDVWRNPALLAAALQYIAAQELRANIHVMLPYADSLRCMADWFCQLWAESLGKNITRRGAVIHAGQTPTKALGVTDQHSQLQLYTEGPFDKVVTFLKVENFRREQPIPHGCADFADVAFLGGKTHSQLIAAELAGTAYALRRAGRMNQTIILPRVDAHTVGQLLYFFELCTAYMGELLDIDAFNQPGVEESKIASFAVLGHPGEKYAKKRQEMQQTPAAQARYVL